MPPMSRRVNSNISTLPNTVVYDSAIYYPFHIQSIFELEVFIEVNLYEASILHFSILPTTLYPQSDKRNSVLRPNKCLISTTEGLHINALARGALRETFKPWMRAHVNLIKVCRAEHPHIGISYTQSWTLSDNQGSITNKCLDVQDSGNSNISTGLNVPLSIQQWRYNHQNGSCISHSNRLRQSMIVDGIVCGVFLDQEYQYLRSYKFSLAFR